MKGILAFVVFAAILWAVAQQGTTDTPQSRCQQAADAYNEALVASKRGGAKHLCDGDGRRYKWDPNRTREITIQHH